MTDHVADLVRQGKRLSRDERSQVVAELLESLQEEEQSAIASAWDAEIERRLAAFDHGETPALAGEAVLSRAQRLAHG